jgi:integrase
MKRISEAAGLSNVYTAHCVRATVVTELHDAGYSTETIAKVTGHKQAASVERCIRRGRKRQLVGGRCKRLSGGSSDWQLVCS